MSAYYGSIGDHLGSVLFLFGGYGAICVWVKWTSRRPRVEEEIPPVSLLPRGRRDVHGRVRAQHPRRGRALGPERSRPSIPPFDWNA